MSYCRWSSDDFQSDVYSYQSEQGYETHVAGMRYVFTEAVPPPASWEDQPSWWARHKKVSEMVETASLQKIGLPFDGQSFTDGTAGECTTRLLSLREAGYWVPQYAIEELQQEAAQIQ